MDNQNGTFKIVLLDGLMLVSPIAGVNEAIKSGELIAKEGIIFDRAFTSLQRRAIKTLWLSLEAANQFHLPVIKDWRLNERHYGALNWV